MGGSSVRHVTKVDTIAVTELHPETADDVRFLKEHFPHCWPCDFVVVAEPAPKVSILEWVYWDRLRIRGLWSGQEKRQ